MRVRVGLQDKDGTYLRARDRVPPPLRLAAPSITAVRVSMECWHAWGSTLLFAFASGPLIILAFVFALWCAGFTALGVVGVVGLFGSSFEGTFSQLKGSSQYAHSVADS